MPSVIRNGKRPIFSPTNTFDRIVYALLALIAPRMLIDLSYREKVDFSLVILCCWWLVALLYTLDWAISSYRKIRSSGNNRLFEG